QITSIAGIIETDVPGYVAPSARRKNSTKIKKADIKLTNIPDDIRPLFKNNFTPPLLEYVGRLEGWEDPTTADIIELWNNTFPQYKASAEDPQVLVVQKLV
ncbi:hypothetical protein B0H10DRAFT_1739882, partial [Mycena sp. CBHHK59/15]